MMRKKQPETSLIRNRQRTVGDLPAALVGVPPDYAAWLTDVKARVQQAQQRALQAVNVELIGLYWHLGRDILERQGREGYGTKVVERLAHDLKAAFPEMKGFSPRNLKYMRRFAELWPELELVQRLLHNLPWFHLCTIIDKALDHRDWYARAAVEYGWSRAILVMQIETAAHERFGKASTNFERIEEELRETPMPAPTLRARRKSRTDA